MHVGVILLIVLALFAISVFPTWRHSAKWGYFPSGALAIVLVLVLILVLMGRI